MAIGAVTVMFVSLLVFASIELNDRDFLFHEMSDDQS